MRPSRCPAGGREMESIHSAFIDLAGRVTEVEVESPPEHVDLSASFERFWARNAGILI